MRILLLTQVVPNPPDVGPRAKTLQVLRHLAQRHDVTLCAFARNPDEQRAAEALLDLCARVETVPLHRSRPGDAVFLVRSLASGDSFLLSRDDRAEMHAMVRRLLDEERIDVVHVDQLNMMRFVPPDWQRIVVLDEHNAVWRMVERLRQAARDPLRRGLLKREARIIRRVEGAACLRAHTVLAVSDPDRAALRMAAGPEASFEVVPIGVDVERFLPVAAARSPQPFRLLSIGTMYWPPNSDGVMWWLREGYERLRATCPDIRYDIVGARPPRRLRRMARGHVGTTLHGYVADASPFWISAGALAVPLLAGGGTRVKILEAMAMSVPVVSTSLGAEGLAVRHGEHVLLADTPAEFADACAAVLRDSALAQRLTERAYQLVREQYDASIALRALDRVYSRLLAEGKFRSCVSRS